MPASKNSANLRASDPVLAAGAALLLGAAAAWWCFARGYTLYYGDAEAHLNIARRIFDSRTPGPYQVGTVWLPLQHFLIAPFAWFDSLWQTGIAGVIPSVVAFAAAAGFLCAATQRALDSRAAGFTAAAIFALNPNMLYLASTPMTEPLAALGLTALLWATLWFRDTQSGQAIVAAGIASNIASLSRYEGWFLIPFVALYLLWIADRKSMAMLFAVIAALGPLAWLAHNQFYYGNALEFYNGPYSAQAIHARQVTQGLPDSPPYYYFFAIRHVAGWLAIIAALAGMSLHMKRAAWPFALLALPGVFYLWSIHSGGTPVLVPELEPYTRYNTRYALAVLPLIAFAASSLVVKRQLWGYALAVVSVAATPICWQEAARASAARRDWTHQAAAFLRENYRPGDGLLFRFGDLPGVVREAGIPLRETIYQDNGDLWDEALARPDRAPVLWALAFEGDEVANAAAQSMRLRQRIAVKGAPVVEIYHRE